VTSSTRNSLLGKVIFEGDRATLIFERRLLHPIDMVWRTITDPNELSKWYLPGTMIEGTLGGKVEFSSELGHVTGSILAWDPPHVFEHEWIVDRPGSPKGMYGVIRWELFSDGNYTVLKLTHRYLPSNIARNFAPGIHAILDRLESFLNNSPLPDWMKRSEELRSSY
jgi:uncharacterized protein YndB with AHSA1/START domain